MSVLYNPRATMTDAQRREAEATIERRRRLNGIEAQERAERATQTAARMDEMVQAINVEIDPAPLVPDETWEDRQRRLNPLPIEKPEWFVIEAEIDQDARHIRIEDIQRTVATRYKISRAELICARRTKNLVRPRQIAMFLAKSLTPKSYPEIGRRFGGRDHTTALHAFRKIEALVARDASLADEVDRLSNLIKGMN